jgi:Tfp pilus assembly PilM family ATPase
LALSKSLRSRFLDRLVPDSVFQVSPTFVSGIRVSKKDRSVRSGFVLPLPGRPVSPSFDRPNLTDPAAVEEAIVRGMKSIRVSSGSVALLLPEPAVRVFILSVESFPGTGRERDAFIRWRIGKQMPLIPDDARIDYATSPGRGARKVIVAMARQTVVREYEALFEKAGLRPDLVTVPSLTLVNLAARKGPMNGILLNLEDVTLTLLAVMDSGWTLYRQKGVGVPEGPEEEARAENIVREVENTIRFLADKEKEKIERLWVRTAAAAERPGLISRLKQRIDLPLEIVDYAAPESWTEAQKVLLAPLVGQIV